MGKNEGKRWKISGGWTAPGTFEVIIEDPEWAPYSITVTAARAAGGLEPRGVTVARSDGRLSARDVRRMPLDSYVRGAVAYIEIQLAEIAVRAIPVPKGYSKADTARALGLDKSLPEAKEALRRRMAPRSRPERGRSEGFYRRILADFDRLTVEGSERPAKEIAEHQRVPVNRVYQWLHRARALKKKQQESERLVREARVSDERRAGRRPGGKQKGKGKR